MKWIEWVSLAGFPVLAPSAMCPLAQQPVLAVDPIAVRAAGVPHSARARDDRAVGCGARAAAAPWAELQCADRSPGRRAGVQTLRELLAPCHVCLD